jgi:ABC-type Fe3+ transport system substrate-binding protein
LTDSDDTAAGQKEGMPITALPMNNETLVIANTVAITESAPHPKAAHQLYEYLQQTAVVSRLIASNALEGADAQMAQRPTLKVNWEKLLANLEGTTARLNEIFLR